MARALFALLTTLLLTFSTPAHALPELDLQPQSLELGGSVTFALDTAGGATDVSIVVAPGGAYWLSERFAILAGINFGYNSFADAVSFGAAGGVQFNILDPSVWTPYVAGTVGFVTGSGGFFRGTVTPAGGIMLAVHPAIALDLGIRLNMSFGDGGFGMNIPIGWFGVRCFFPLKGVTG